MEFDINSWMVAWTPSHPGEIEVNEWPDKRGWSNRYYLKRDVGSREKLSKWQKMMLMFVDFNICVVRDGIDPQKAHSEFLKIKEYRNIISPDIEDAR